METFGALESYQLDDRSKDIYELGVFGGSIPYWENFPRGGFDETVEFRARFAREGAGIVKISFVLVGGERRIRAIAFGLEADEENARERMERAGCNFGNF